ncbi:hypothetical protein [Mycobacterium angelicum]|uniref:hypothetical protein n=1 Tax=Mycobacterium angelicum TaxID=470074 RepID=UPI00111BD45E|nr:hypothetical protein [Mycobacterium angelicum]MCV7198453.1 hypothetical protein [Mycobacterium angelicum]
MPKMLVAGAIAAAAVALTGVPVAQADPPLPARAQYLGDGGGAAPCQDDGCRQPPQVAPPTHRRGFIGCVRGVCVPRRR